MKKILATLSLMALPAFAERPLTADIPFDFMAGETRMVAGGYEISYPVAGTVAVGSRVGKCVMVSHAARKKTAPKVASLVFRKHGETYFLSQVWHPDMFQGRELPPSKAARELANNGAGAVLAYVPVRAR
jgi:hypothetical protein